jgi:hypothetical protein
MPRSVFVVLFVLIGTAGAALAQTGTVPGAELGVVRIPTAVLADGKPLPTGTYHLRLASQPATGSSQTSDTERAVEFVADGVVVARETAEIFSSENTPDVGASSEPAAEGVRVQTLKGGEFLRISVTRSGMRYLIYLPIV